MKSYQRELYRVAGGVNDFLTKAFSRIHIEGPPLDPARMAEDPTMVVCTHRSQVDYFILGWMAHELGVRNMRFAAGDNLTELPYLGERFRRYGAFPVRRDRARSKTYVRELCSQVVAMVEDGDSIIVFPEAGRSYKGNMLEVRNGMLAAHILAQARNPGRRHVFWPVAISYERLPELLYFDMLQKGKDIRRSRRSFLQRIRGNVYYFGADLLAFSKFFFKKKVGRRYGEVYVDYGEPMAVGDTVDLEANYNPKARDDFSAHRRSMLEAGQAIRTRFLELYRLLPVHILAAILRERPRLSVKETMRAVRPLVERLAKENRNLKSLEGLSDREIVENGIRQCGYMGAVWYRNRTLAVRKSSVIHYYAASTDSQ
jgi:1-acyl-sn-glycerol-3-phosphate acyltransferase